MPLYTACKKASASGFGATICDTSLYKHTTFVQYNNPDHHMTDRRVPHIATFIKAKMYENTNHILFCLCSESTDRHKNVLITVYICIHKVNTLRKSSTNTCVLLTDKHREQVITIIAKGLHTVNTPGKVC